MGTLTITKAHLQYAQSLMAYPLAYPQVFFEDAKMFFIFFPLMDQKATTTAIIKLENAEIEPSAFGQTVIRFAKQNFVTDREAFMPLLTREFDKDTQKTLQYFATHLFLNLAAWYICPLLAANNYFSPYMPRPWILKYLAEKRALTKEERTKYFKKIVAFLASVEDKRWVFPYDNLAGQLGPRGVGSLLFLIGMFLEAHEKNEAFTELRKKLTNLASPVLEFLDTLNLEGFEGKK